MGKSRPISWVIIKAVLALITLSFVLLATISVIHELVRFNKQVAMLEEEMYNEQKDLIARQVQQTIGFIEFSQKNIEDKLIQKLQHEVENIEANLKDLMAANGNQVYNKELVKSLSDDLQSTTQFSDKLLSIKSLNGEEFVTILPKNDSLALLYKAYMYNKKHTLIELQLLKKGNKNVLHQVVSSSDSIDKAYVTTLTYIKAVYPFKLYISLQTRLPDNLSSSKPLFIDYLSVAYNKATFTPVLFSSKGMLLTGNMFGNKPPFSIINMVDSYGVGIFNEINKVAWDQNGGFVQFYNPLKRADQPEEILGYFKALPDWNWIVGAYTNLRAIDAKIDKQAKDMRRDLAIRVFQIILILLITYLGIVFAMAYISKKFTPELSRFQQEVKKAVGNHTEINLDGLKITELKEMGLLLNEVLNVHFQILYVLESKEEMYRLITESSNDAIFTVDEHGRFLFVTSSIQKLLGYEANQLIGKRVLQFLSNQSRKKMLNRLRQNEFKSSSFLSQVIDVEIVNDIAELLIVEVSLRCVRTHEGKFMFYSGMARNVTQSRIDRQALEESEMRYKLLADNINDVIWTSDLNLNTTYISPSVYRLEGYKPEERKALSIDKILTPRSYQFISELMKRILIEYAEGLKDFRDSSELFDIEIIRKDGSKFWAEVNASLMFDSEGNVVGISGVTRDISDRKRIENALKASEKKLLELNATKDKFFSILAHDLKNPFNSILGFSNELVQNYNAYNDEERKQFVSTIQSSAQGAYQLLGNLLEWSTLQTGRLSVSKSSFFLYELVREVLYEVSGQVLAKEIVVENQVNTELQVYADRKMIATVIRNLISNAIKFTEKSGFIAINSSISGDIATVSVKDTGKGMKPELVIKLFKIQEKLSTVGTAGEKGTGLGLILCKEFVEQNGGKIWVSSKWQEGSTFFFTLQKA